MALTVAQRVELLTEEQRLIWRQMGNDAFVAKTLPRRLEEWENKQWAMESTLRDVMRRTASPDAHTPTIQFRHTQDNRQDYDCWLEDVFATLN